MTNQSRKGVGARLRLLRLENELNLVRASDAAGISVSLLSTYERGASPIGVDNLSKLLDIYGHSELFDELKWESLVERKRIEFTFDREQRPAKADALLTLLRAADAGRLDENDWEQIRLVAERANSDERG